MLLLMQNLPDLYLMRHGQTVWNAEGRLQGHLHSPLDNLGIRQAHWQAQLIAGISGHRVASPQGRARQTAQIVFAGHPWSSDDRLGEIGIGQFAGRLLSDVQAMHPELFQGAPLAWYDRCPKGEGFARLATRCESFLSQLSGPTLVISHGVTLRMLRVLALGLPLTALADGDVPQGTVLLLRNRQARLLRHKDDPRR